MEIILELSYRTRNSPDLLMKAVYANRYTTRDVLLLLDEYYFARKGTYQIRGTAQIYLQRHGWRNDASGISATVLGNFKFILTEEFRFHLFNAHQRSLLYRKLLNLLECVSGHGKHVRWKKAVKQERNL